MIHVASSNAGKLREFAAAAAGSGWEIVPLPGLAAIPPPIEDADSFEGNAILKAEYYSQFSTDIILSDDSGLVVEALNGAPGVYSARFAGPAATDAENNQLLLERLAGCTKRDARFVAVVALARNGKCLVTAQGEVRGEILESRLGKLGFGYDPLFFYPPLQRSFGELDTEQKLEISHRGLALKSALARLALAANSLQP